MISHILTLYQISISNATRFIHIPNNPKVSVCLKVFNSYTGLKLYNTNWKMLITVLWNYLKTVLKQYDVSYGRRCFAVYPNFILLTKPIIGEFGNVFASNFSYPTSGVSGNLLRWRMSRGFRKSIDIFVKVHLQGKLNMLISLVPMYRKRDMHPRLVVMWWRWRL